MKRQHYKPMLARVADAAFDSEDWIFEVKWDGIRAISYVNAELSIRSRNDRELKPSFPELEELKDLTSNAVLDGEIVLMRDGKADFQTLLERNRNASPYQTEYMAQKYPATYVVFDILEKDGRPLINLPLTERKRLLKEHLKEGKHVVLSMFVEEKGKTYYEAAIDKGIEGIVAKKKDSPYRPGLRSDDWLKIKKLRSCDCVIFGYTAGEGKRQETFGALILGLYDEKANPVYVGKVGTGFSQRDTEFLMKTFQNAKAEETTLKGVDASEKVTWLEPEFVCVVAYQTVTKDGKLRMPRFRALRTDKNALECTLEQIRPSSLKEHVT